MIWHGDDDDHEDDENEDDEDEDDDADDDVLVVTTAHKNNRRDTRYRQHDKNPEGGLGDVGLGLAKDVRNSKVLCWFGRVLRRVLGVGACPLQSGIRATN